MLLNRAEREAIASGAVDRVFRRWRRPTVKAGGTLKAAGSLFAIDAVEEVERDEIDAAEAKKAGHDDLASLLAALERRRGTIYRIRLHRAGDDPRLALRQDADLSPDDLRAIGAKLGRLDRASRRGPWTRATLSVIGERPQVVSTELAAAIGAERFWFKGNVRKLKAMGLTISHERGYELSPRGRAVLEAIEGSES